jgi:hypothetical protein
MWAHTCPVDLPAREPRLTALVSDATATVKPTTTVRHALNARARRPYISIPPSTPATTRPARQIRRVPVLARAMTTPGSRSSDTYVRYFDESVGPLPVRLW